MIFRQFLHEDRSCASYLVGCASKEAAAIFDPQGDITAYQAAAKRFGLTITDVIDSHVHADHPSAARELAAKSGAILRMGQGSEVGFAYEAISDDDVISVGNRSLRMIHTPGHTPEHVCVLVDDWFVLTGDTLFVGDVGRVDLALTDLNQDELKTRARTLHASVQKLLALPDETEVYPGHYSGSTCGRGMEGKTISTIGRERRTSPALALDLGGFVDYQMTSAPPLPKDFEVIKRANMGLDEIQGGG